MRKIRVLYYGSCWPTNIGNSFVNLGAIHSIGSAIGDGGEVFHFGGMSSYLFSMNRKPQNTLSVGQIVECDYVAIGGMTMCVENFQTQAEVLQQFLDQGTKIIIVGGGDGRYNKWEVKEVRKWMKKIPIYIFISRDRYSYEEYCDLVPHSYDGIDSAFFVPDCFRLTPLNLPEFDILNFDSMDEPRIDHGKRLVIRTHHSCWPTRTKTAYFKHKNTLISDLPTDYLSLYAQVSTTYSDRVHACLATLAFGNKAMLFGNKVPRVSMFERIDVCRILEEPVRVDMNRLLGEKAEQIKFLKSVLI